MKRRSQAVALAFLIFCFSSPSQAVFYAGELTTSDALAVDEGFGDFYFDLYYLTVDVPMTIEIFMRPLETFAPWVGYWDGDLTATPDYDSPPPEGIDFSSVVGDQLYLAFDAVPDTKYQIMATTFEFNPTALGAYNFFIVNPERDDTGINTFQLFNQASSSVPAPASWLILLVGLITMSILGWRTTSVSGTRLFATSEQPN